VIVPLREASEENDLAEQIGAGILMLVAFVALRMTLWHAADVIFRLIDLAFAPEPLMIAERLNRASDPRRSVSVLLVALPVFIVAFRMFSKRLDRHPSLLHGKLLVVALALFVLDTTIVALTTIPAFLFNLISDAAALPNLFKIVAFSTVYGALLAFLWGIARGRFEAGARGAFANCVGALGACALIGGAFTMEPAWIGEAQEADLQRQRDLAAIASAIVNFENQVQDLPYDLPKLAESPRLSTAPLPLADPATGQLYQYARVDSHRYKHCATFKLESLPFGGARAQTLARDPIDPWTHAAGATCFVFERQSPSPLPNLTQGGVRS
jgi:hypothetical protein